MAERAWAQFQGDALILLTHEPIVSDGDCWSCTDEGCEEPCMPLPDHQEWVLRIMGPDYVTAQDDVLLYLDDALAALDLAIDPEVGAALASDGSGVYVAFARSYMSARWTVAGIAGVGLDGQGLLSWPIDPDVYEHALPMEQLSLRAYPQAEIQLGFLQQRSDPNARVFCEQCCPDGADCDCRDSHVTASLLGAQFGHSQALRWTDFPVSDARQLQLLQGSEDGGVVLATRTTLIQNDVTQRPEEEDPGPPQPPPPEPDCQSHDVVYGFSPAFDQRACAPTCQESQQPLREMLLLRHGAVEQISAFAHNGLPAALVHTHDFGLSVVASTTTGELWTEGVAPPAEISYRYWGKSQLPHRPLSATLSTPGGALVVVVIESPIQSRAPSEYENDGAPSNVAPIAERPNGLALFSVGCGATIPPLRDVD